jgi:hypothetical protein
MNMETIEQHFAGYFVHPYGGEYHRALASGPRPPEAESGRADFCRLTNNAIIWTQVHGDFKNKAKAALFVPYAHWRELHDACRDSVREWSKDKEVYNGNPTCAAIMQTAMEILMKRNGLKAPPWWIPMLMGLRER